jgi:uncharacterized protein
LHTITAMKTLLKKLPEDYQNSIKEILCLFEKVDIETRRFTGISNIHCPAGCGDCCNSLKIETTALEMMPLAAYLWSKNQADKILSGLSQAKSATCIFFKKHPSLSRNGYCGIYKLRPLICRLFGFFTVKDKHGKYVYGSCKIIKQHYPDTYKKALKAIEQGMHPSNMTDFAIRVLAQGSDLGRRMLPVNIAAKIALEKIGFILELGQSPPNKPKPKAA